jgi:ribonuclease HI
MREVTAYFDGCCEPVNPGGHASYGAVVLINGERVFEKSGYVGHGPQCSNNVAEYSGCISVLQYLIDREDFNQRNQLVTIRGDSKLVVMQLTKRWRVKRGLYVPFYYQAASLFAQFGVARLEWIPRDQNSIADELSKRVLKERHVEFRLQKEG